ncbi:hypothetical protein EJ071_18520 [Mesorhizobium sp. M1B.F.Ca.ET.045.04.1.1]|nr:hypothetical protein EJ071_18520 [Mesorhizobium sp. M1B.F.Ca.ET.045.04.1.1]
MQVSPGLCRPSPLPSPREERGEGVAGVAASSLLPVTIRGEGAGRRMRGGAKAGRLIEICGAH